MGNNRKKESQMKYWQSYKFIVLKILGIINSEEKRDLRNIALDKDTLSTHSGRGKEQDMKKTEREMIMETKLARIAQISKEKPKEVFTSIYHFLNKDLLRLCHKELDGKKATGLDGITKAEYEENLEENIERLEKELQNMKYVPSPAKRVYIPKANGKTRGLAIANYEDKIVQLAMKKIIEAVFEPKLPKCMYGFRANKSCHDALKDLNRNIEHGKVSYVADADIKGFFDHVNHEWLIKCVEQHIRDPRVIRMIKRFLKAGVVEKTVKIETEEGTPQGSILSPILANIYMYYVLALWFEKKIQTNFKGESYITVYADDFVCCFQYKWEAEQFIKELLPERLKKFSLELAEDKTRLISFGRFAKRDSKDGKVETFDFLGFTHYCGKSKDGRFRVKRKTSKKKFKAKIKEMKIWIKSHRQYKVNKMIKEINVKLKGHYQYYGITDNSYSLNAFREITNKLLWKWLNRRSGRKSYTPEEFKELLKHLPLLQPKIYINIYDKV